MRYARFTGLLLLVLLTCCRREEDQEFPQIVILQPSTGISVTAFDTLQLAIKVSDNENLTECAVRVVNSNMVPVFAEVVMPLSGREDTVRMNYVLNDMRVPSGTCYVEVRVSDGRNNARQFRQIQFTQQPRRLLGLCFVTTNAQNQSDIYRCDTTWQPQLLVPQTFSQGDIAVSSWWQQIYLSANNAGVMRAEPLAANAPAWQYNVPQGPPETWRSICVHNNKVWAAHYSGESIKAFDEFGVLTYNVACGPGMRPYKINCTGRYAIAAAHDASQTQKQLEVFDVLTGNAVQVYPLALDVKAIEPVDSVSVLVYGNEQGQGRVYLYNVLTNSAWQPYTLSTGMELITACRIDSNAQLVSLQNGAVMKFTLNPIGMVPWSLGVQPRKICYDPESNAVFIADGTTISRYDYATGLSMNFFSTPLPVVDFELWHNR
jgi:hypothetical protein